MSGSPPFFIAPGAQQETVGFGKNSKQVPPSLLTATLNTATLALHRGTMRLSQFTAYFQNGR